MPKYSPLVAAIIGAAILVIQQAVSDKNWDLKVVGLAAIIAIAGAVATVLKGKGASILGAVGTVLYTAVTIYNTGVFTWGEFALTSALAVLSLFAPTLIPQPEEKNES